MNEDPESGPPAVLQAANPQDIVRAATMLRDGKVLVVPTDTVYGLAASVFHPEAIDRVMRMKGRGPSSPLPILMGSASDLPLLCKRVPRLAWRLIERFWPGPLTLAFPARGSVDRRLMSATGTVACRVPDNQSGLQMLEALGGPVTGTSANRSGLEACVRGREAAAGLAMSPDAVLLDDEHVRGGAPSTVVEVRETLLVLHREGPIRVEDLRLATGARVVRGQALEDLTVPR